MFGMGFGLGRRCARAKGLGTLKGVTCDGEPLRHGEGDGILKLDGEFHGISQWSLKGWEFENLPLRN